MDTTETTHTVEQHPPFPSNTPGDTPPSGATRSLSEQYRTLTERCGLVDCRERGKLTLTGADALEFLNGQVTNELLDLAPGQGRYAAFLTHKGKMLGDLRILVAGKPGGTPDELLLDTERVALQELFDMIRRFKVGYRVELHKRTLESSLLSLIGPDANEVIRATLDDHEPARRGGEIGGYQTRAGLPEYEHDHTLTTIAGKPVRLIRTDLGVDALLDSTAIDGVREALDTAGAVPVSEAAAEIARVESGRPRYGIDIDESTIPQEAGLNERAVNFTKGCYVGQETVARLHYKGKPNRHLRGLRLSEPVPSGADLRLGERSVGHLASAVHSPRFGPIGLALIRREAEPGTSVAAGDQGATATVVELPFQ